jgi:hypothetical protein
MLLLAEGYRKLGLIWASKYHAFAAAYITFRSDDDDLKALFVSGLHEIAACNYMGGEWVSLSELLPLLLTAHYEFANDPDNWEEHERLQATVYHFFVARALAKALNGDTVTSVLNAPIAATNMPEDLHRDLLCSDIGESRFEALSASQVRESVHQEFFGVPLSDTGPVRTYAWSALGIQWSIVCSNNYECIGQVEQFVAVLQVALADLANRDLCLLPTVVSIQAELGTISRAHFEMLPGNDKSGMKVVLPRSSPNSPATMDELQQDVCRIALSVLIHCSCLSDADFFRELDSSFRDGLSSKVFIARPYSELFREFVNGTDFVSRRTTPLGPAEAESYVMRTAPELGWPETPGPGYTTEKALMQIRNRYERAERPIMRTLARLRPRPKFQEWVAKHRADGRKDWWILLVLMNTIINYRAKLETGGKDVHALRRYMERVMYEDEPAGGAEFSDEILFSVDMEMAANAFNLTAIKGWSLTVRSATPDVFAIDKLLNVRYGHGADDVEHKDLFCPF